MSELSSGPGHVDYVEVDDALCNGCDVCIDVCPSNVYASDPEGGNLPVVVYPRECWYCGACVMDCPTSAIKLRIPLSMKVSILRG